MKTAWKFVAFLNWTSFYMAIWLTVFAVIPWWKGAIIVFACLFIATVQMGGWKEVKLNND